MKTLTKTFLKDPLLWQFWVVLALIVKGIIFFFQLSHAETRGMQGFLGSFGGDTDTYIGPIDHWLSAGSYDPDFRMPGYGIIYFIFRIFFAKAVSLNIIIILQYITASLSVYALALISRQVLRSTLAFYITFYLFLLSTYSNLEDAGLLTESFTVSFLVFAVFFILKWSRTYKSGNLLLAGLLTTEVIFLRPVFAPLLLLFCLFVFLWAKNDGKNNFLKSAIILLVPFVIIDGIWIVRNYQVRKRIIPLTATLYGAVGGGRERMKLAAEQFIQSWGGNFVPWDPSSPMRFFNLRETMTDFHKKQMPDAFKPFPSDIYTSAFNADSLIKLKNLIADIQRDTDSVNAITRYNYVADKFDAYKLSVKKEKPFVYYIKAPLRMARSFFVHSGTYNLFPKGVKELNWMELGIKVFYSLFYVISLLLGFMGVVLLGRKSLFLGPEVLVTGIVTFTAVIHPIVLKLNEIRYFLPAWPFLLICVTYSLIWLWGKVNRQKISS